MCCLRREWLKKPMIFSAKAFARRSRAHSVRNADGAASGTADCVEAESVSAETPEDIVNGCYDEAAAFIRALRRRHSKALDCRSFSFGRTLLRHRSRLRTRLLGTDLANRVIKREASNAFSPTVVVLSLEFHGD